MRKNNRFLAGIFCLFVLTLIGCSSDNIKEGNSVVNDEGTISNNEVAFTYNPDLLSEFVKIKQKNILLKNTPPAVTANSLSDFVEPDLSEATDLTELVGTQIVLGGGQTYYIPEGETFSENVSFSGASTVYVLGTWGDSGSPTSVSGSTIIVAPSGNIQANDFSLWDTSAKLENYGNVVYNSATLVGEIINYHHIVFTAENVQINPAAKIENNCLMEFDYSVRIEIDLDNHGQIKFNDGFVLTNFGKIILNEQTVLDVLGGQATYESTIKNEGNYFARINVASGASLESSSSVYGLIEGKIDVNGDVSEEALNMDEEGTVNNDVYIAGTSCIETQGVNSNEDDCDGASLQLMHIAEVISPTMEGETNEIVLSATDVKVNNGLAYLSYHTNDEVYGNMPYGAVRILDVSNVTNPSLINEVKFTNLELNGIAATTDRLFGVGGNKAGGRLLSVELNNGIFDSSVEDESALEQFEVLKLDNISGKNVYNDEDYLWVASKGEGNSAIHKISTMDDYSVVESYTVSGNLKYVLSNDQFQVALTLDDSSASLRIAQLDGSNANTYTYNISPTVIDGKNTITLDEEYVYVALSDKGVAKIKLEDGALVDTFEPNNYRLYGDKIFKKNGLTNAVALSGCYLFLANGNDGVIILNKNTFEVMGSFELDESSNYVFIKDQLIYVATGRDGLNIIQINS